MNNSTIKITDEELNTVRTVQAKFQDVRFQFGGLYIEKLAVDAAIKAITDREGQLQEAWKGLQKQENDIIEAILKKYGEGNLDLSKGEFIPSEQK
jgi:hypothetical protein